MTNQETARRLRELAAEIERPMPSLPLSEMTINDAVEALRAVVGSESASLGCEIYFNRDGAVQFRVWDGKYCHCSDSLGGAVAACLVAHQVATSRPAEVAQKCLDQLQANTIPF